MSKSNLIIIIYVIGIIFCALALEIWDAEGGIKKAGIALGWTAIFLIALFYADKYDQN
tara:strand:- start:379 stop:552 length:174 start_codon:yes stop_codon:yes gene_type:complete